MIAADDTVLDYHVVLIMCTHTVRFNPMLGATGVIK